MNHIAIVGCGPAGLSAAVALHDAGFSITLFERFDQPGPVGSGLMLQPTGLAVLEQLGLRSEVEQLGQRIDGMLGCIAPEGKVVLDINYKALSADLYGVAIHRASLFHVLYQAVHQRGITIETGREIESVIYPDAADQQTTVVSLLTADGTTIDGNFSLVIDASGSHSKLVASAVESSRRTTLEYGALWATVKLDSTGFSRHLLEQRYQAASVMAGVLPCGNLPDDSSEVATLFWSLRTSDYQSLMQSGIEAWKQQIVAVWPAVEPLTDQLNDFSDLTHACYAHHTLKTPFRRNVVYIGDAAHSTSPQLGQGVNMALLDAAALAAALTASLATRKTEKRSAADSTAALQTSLKKYTKARQTHVRLFQTASYLLTPFYQSDSTIMPLIRDLLFEPVSKLPYADKLVTSLGAGLLGKPLRSIANISA